MADEPVEHSGIKVGTALMVKRDDVTYFIPPIGNPRVVRTEEGVFYTKETVQVAVNNYFDKHR